MKRKPHPSTEPAPKGPAVPPQVVSPEIIESAKRTLETDRIKPASKCAVCGAEATPNPAEQLCWVCRRLKISAWREIEQQIPAQE